jgi:hypothetical protein
MSRESNCRCLICNLERTLSVEIARSQFEVCYESFAHSRSLLATFPAASDLVSFLHTRSTNNGIPISDHIVRELLQTTATAGDASLRDLLLLAFIPMLHSTSRQVARRYPSLPPEDISQHVVLSLLQILRSPEFYTRSSHIAFAISRVLKRNTFEWARRENRLAVRSEGEEAVSEFAFLSDSGAPFERAVLLRHFLHCCHARGLLTGDDLALLVQFKLDAARDRKAGGPAAVYSNASRQRMKRLLAKLRRVARARAVSTQLRLF